MVADPVRGTLEVQTEHDRALALEPTAYSGEVLRVRCRWRHEGVRPGRWTRFLLVPDEGQTLADLEALAPRAAQLYLEGGGGRRV